jgi:hypothetical protein
MNFLKKIFSQDDLVIGLCGLKKRKEYVKLTISDSYKKTYIQNISQNYLLSS